MSYKKNNVIVRINSPASPPPPDKKKSSFNWAQAITVFVSVGTIVFSVVSYVVSQELVDRRKYNNAYYDERYKVLKEITKSISEINVIIGHHEADKYSAAEKQAIWDKISVFDYSYLVLDQKKEDSVTLNMINRYQISLRQLIQSNDIHPREVYEQGKSTIIQCGKILNDEKDHINSVHFKLFSRLFLEGTGQ